jgi:hypothetical protein
MGVYDDHQSGYWAVPEYTAKDLIGKHIYLHKKQAGLSWHGGVILSYYMADYEGKPRVVFVYKPALPQKGVKAPKSSWGPYVEKLVTDDGIHLLHKDPKDPKSKGLWGPVQG